MISEILILLVVWLAPIVLLLGLAYFRKWQLSRQGRRVPVSDKLLRAPGESLRKKLEELEDELSSGLAMLLTLPLACASIYLISRGRPTAAAGAVGIALAGVPIYAVICWRMLRTIDRQRRYRLGLSGERAVGEELNQLMLEGCRVYHDVPNEPYGNVDHVLVAPSGVYAVETKTRRKKDAEGSNAHKAFFDGKTLRFGDGSPETRCLEQARQQASRLGDWLSKAVGDPVQAQAVLSLPGWFVERGGRGEVIVVSGKNVRSLVKGPARIDALQIRRISHQLEQRCRDVEF